MSIVNHFVTLTPLNHLFRINVMNRSVDPIEEITEQAILDMRLQFEEHTNKVLAMFDEYEERIVKAFEPLLEDLKQRQKERMLK